MMWSRSLLTVLACTQLSLVAIQRQRLPVVTSIRAEAPEGISLLVDHIANSKYGLLSPLPGKTITANSTINSTTNPTTGDGIPLDQLILDQASPAIDKQHHLDTPEWLWPVIQQESSRHGLDPLLIESIICQESGFQCDTVSSAGAQGLMQLMPETANLVGVTDVFDPRQNIAGGSQYLAWQIQDFGGDLSLALAAYNAGPAAVRRWGGIPPYGETNHYVRSVLEDYHRKAQTGTANMEIQGYLR